MNDTYVVHVTRHFVVDDSTMEGPIGEYPSLRLAQEAGLLAMARGLVPNYSLDVDDRTVVTGIRIEFKS